MKLNHELDLQSAGSSPNLTYTKVSARDAIRTNRSFVDILSWYDMAWSSLIWSENTSPHIFTVSFGWDLVGSSKKKLFYRVSYGQKLPKIGHLRSKYSWIQLDLDFKYLPSYIVSDFSVQSSWFQPKNCSTECQMGKNCQNRQFWPILICFEAKIWLGTTWSGPKIPPLVYCQWFLVKIQLVPAK